tara:strand:+ start:228 stop:521 length:294 start_codon:yes stop_codon:yes gene_type:complete
MNRRRDFEPGTSWTNGSTVRHIRSVTRSPTGLPTQINYVYDYIDYRTEEYRKEGYYGSCLHTTFDDWANRRWKHDTHKGVWGEGDEYLKEYGDQRGK